MKSGRYLLLVVLSQILLLRRKFLVIQIDGEVILSVKQQVQLIYIFPVGPLFCFFFVTDVANVPSCIVVAASISADCVVVATIPVEEEGIKPSCAACLYHLGNPSASSTLRPA